MCITIFPLNTHVKGKRDMIECWCMLSLYPYLFTNEHFFFRNSSLTLHLNLAAQFIYDGGYNIFTAKI